MATIEQSLRQATLLLKQSGSESSRLDAEVLLAHCLGLGRTDLYRLPARALTETEERCFTESTARRSRGEPVAYITGWKEFWSIRLKVGPDVLIPRPDTEILVEEAVNFCQDRSGCRLLELGTGSGAISIAVAATLCDVDIMATDISPGALRIAAENAALNGVADRIDFRQGDLFEPISGTFDAVVSNPPYIPQREFERLPTGVRGFEPALSLLAGPDGTEFHERIVSGARAYLAPQGWVFMEIGAGQEERIERLFKKFGYSEIGLVRDYAGVFRVAKARGN